MGRTLLQSKLTFAVSLWETQDSWQSIPRHDSLVRDTTEAISTHRVCITGDINLALVMKKDGQRSMWRVGYQHGSETTWSAGDQPDLDQTQMQKNFPVEAKIAAMKEVTSQ